MSHTKNVQGTPRGRLYLLHFDVPYKHARHYLGYAGHGVRRRLKEHAAGRGARLTAVVRAAGIGWLCVRVWKGTRSDERRLKRWNGLGQLCPVCSVRPKAGGLSAGRVPR